VNGQGKDGGGKAIWLVDPIWLYETSQEDDFSQGLEKWSLYTFTNLRLKPGRKQGPQLLEDTAGKGGKVLHIRKSNAEQFTDAAVWNFPMGRRGAVEMKVKIPEGSSGCSISLTDSHRHPNDPEGEKEAMFSYSLKENGSILVKPNSWNILKLKWDMKMRTCAIYLNDEFVQNISQLNDSGMGISYVRFKSLAADGTVDDAGIMLDYINAKVEEVYSLKVFE
jgi:hypothetical protein